MPRVLLVGVGRARVGCWDVAGRVGEAQDGGKRWIELKEDVQWLLGGKSALGSSWVCTEGRPGYLLSIVRPHLVVVVVVLRVLSQMGKVRVPRCVAATVMEGLPCMTRRKYVLGSHGPRWMLIWYPARVMTHKRTGVTMCTV